MHPLQALTPLDGRYGDKTAGLHPFFSEYALIRYRLKVEIEYLIALSREPLKNVPPVSEEKAALLRAMITNFSLEEAEKVKALESVTNHDVKALEYFLKEKIEAENRFTPEEKEAWSRYVHFALTSQDINNTAIPLMLKDGIHSVYLPLLAEMVKKLEFLADKGAKISMLARTHGQPASPTTLGKEVFVFIERLKKQAFYLQELTYPAKFGGAVGNFNAHMVAYPKVDWVGFANRFTEDILGLERSQTTTQIEHYDGLASVFDNLRRINVILIDLSRDVWQYISMGYFGQTIKAGEVGSSTMPHKVNPIDFENAEGNLGLANAVFDHLSNKLPISRLQRDLTDSTVLRNVGVPLGYTVVALQSLLKGIGKLQINATVIEQDLESRWEVLAEAIQVVLKREGIADAYEQLKALTRTDTHITQETLRIFIESLPIEESVKEELYHLTPQRYIGNA